MAKTIVINAIKEIEELYGDIEALEIKFGIDSIDNVVIYQVRPFVELFDKPMALTDKEFFDAKSFAKCDYLDTNHVLSDMASWRPAEILGLNPRPLDCSLYKEFITSGKWNESISHFGYATEINDIMQKIGNKPYISVEYSIAGLTPKSLSSNIKFKLKEYYIDKLKKKPQLHERLERDLIFNCYDFASKDKLMELSDYGFSDEVTDTLELLSSGTGSKDSPEFYARIAASGNLSAYFVLLNYLQHNRNYAESIEYRPDIQRYDRELAALHSAMKEDLIKFGSEKEGSGATKGYSRKHS